MKARRYSLLIGVVLGSFASLYASKVTVQNDYEGPVSFRLWYGYTDFDKERSHERVCHHFQDFSVESGAEKLFVPNPYERDGSYVIPRILLRSIEAHDGSILLSSGKLGGDSLSHWQVTLTKDGTFIRLRLQ